MEQHEQIIYIVDNQGIDPNRAPEIVKLSLREFALLYNTEIGEIDKYLYLHEENALEKAATLKDDNIRRGRLEYHEFAVLNEEGEIEGYNFKI